MGQLYQELKRRNVIRVAIMYAVAAWLLIQIADTIFPILSLPGWSVTLVTILLFIGFPVALIFAWAYELTPEGIRLEKHVVRENSITHLTGRKLDFVIIAMLVLAVGFLSYDKFVLDPGRDAELLKDATEAATDRIAETQPTEPIDLAIAVLPFADLSPAGDHEYFSDGISEEILNVLAHIPDLRVISRSSAFSFKGKNVDIPTVANQLGVSHVLEGSVRKSGDRVRITAQLIDARTDSHVWSESYDRALEDIFEIQDEISRAIVATLKEHLGIRAEKALSLNTTAILEARDALLRGRYLVAQRTQATVQNAVREFDMAVTLDPNYAPAYAELAIATIFLSHYAGLPVDVVVARAAPHAERSMLLDPGLAESHAAAGLISYYKRNIEEALTHFEQAIGINPNYAIVYNWMGIVLDELGRYDMSFTARETALRLDPLSIPTRSNYVGMLINRNRLADAEHELEKLASFHPSFSASARGKLTSRGGKWTNAILANLDALRLSPEMGVERNELSLLFAILGLGQEAIAVSERPLPRVLRMLGRPADAVTMAQVRLAEDPTDTYARRDLGRALASAGDYARSRPILEEMWRSSGGRSLDPFGIDSAAALIAIRRDAGEGAEIGELVAAIKDDVRRHREAGITAMYDLFEHVDYQEGLAIYLSGEKEKGLALIARSADDGFFILPREAYLQVLYDDPGFAPIRAGQRARQTRERERFLAIVCSENPYDAVWQPAEGTCERFAATHGS